MDTCNGISYHYYLKARTAWEFADIFTDSNNWDNSLKAVNENVKKDSKVLSEASQNGQSKVVCQKSELSPGQQCSKSWIVVDPVTMEVDLKEAVEEHVKEDIAPTGSCANHDDSLVDVRVREEPKNDYSHYNAPSEYGENYESTLLTPMVRDLLPPIDEPNEGCCTNFVTHSLEPSSSNSLVETETDEVPYFESDRSDMVQPVINIYPVKEEPMEINTACNAPVTLDNGFFPPNIDVIPFQATIPCPIPYQVVPVTASFGNQSNDNTLSFPEAVLDDVDRRCMYENIYFEPNRTYVDNYNKLKNSESTKPRPNSRDPQGFQSKRMCMEPSSMIEPFRNKKDGTLLPESAQIQYALAPDKLYNTEMEVISCTVCFKPYACIYCFYDHCQEHYKSQVCPYCNKIFIDAYSLNIHLKTTVHSDENMKICPHCGKAFDNLNSMLFHHRDHMSNNFYVCQHCNLGFSMNHELQRHLLKHVYDKHQSDPVKQAGNRALSYSQCSSDDLTIGGTTFVETNREEEGDGCIEADKCHDGNSSVSVEAEDDGKGQESAEVLIEKTLGSDSESRVMESELGDDVQVVNKRCIPLPLSVNSSDIVPLDFVCKHCSLTFAMNHELQQHLLEHVHSVPIVNSAKKSDNECNQNTAVPTAIPAENGQIKGLCATVERQQSSPVVNPNRTYVDNHDVTIYDKLKNSESTKPRPNSRDPQGFQSKRMCMEPSSMIEPFRNKKDGTLLPESAQIQYALAPDKLYNTEIEVISCKVCFKPYACIYCFYDHCQEHYKSQVCPYCNKIFIDAYSLNIHLKTTVHRDENMKICPHCGKAFENLSSMLFHHRDHMHNNFYVCQHCNLGFSMNHELQRHLLKHVYDKHQSDPVKQAGNRALSYSQCSSDDLTIGGTTFVETNREEEGDGCIEADKCHDGNSSVSVEAEDDGKGQESAEVLIEKTLGSDSESRVMESELGDNVQVVNKRCIPLPLSVNSSDIVPLDFVCKHCSLTFAMNHELQQHLLEHVHSVPIVNSAKKSDNECNQNTAVPTAIPAENGQIKGLCATIGREQSSPVVNVVDKDESMGVEGICVDDAGVVPVDIKRSGTDAEHKLGCDGPHVVPVVCVESEAGAEHIHGCDGGLPAASITCEESEALVMTDAPEEEAPLLSDIEVDNETQPPMMPDDVPENNICQEIDRETGRAPPGGAEISNIDLCIRSDNANPTPSDDHKLKFSSSETDAKLCHGEYLDNTYSKAGDKSCQVRQSPMTDIVASRCSEQYENRTQVPSLSPNLEAANQDTWIDDDTIEVGSSPSTDIPTDVLPSEAQVEPNSPSAICEDPASNSDLELGNAPLEVARKAQKEEADHIINTEDDEDAINNSRDSAGNAPEGGTHENGAGNTTTSINISKTEDTVTDDDQSAYTDLFIHKPVSTHSDCQLELTCKYCHHRHIHSYKGDRANICVHCDQVFANPSDLTEHFQTHRKERKFVCPHCRKEFKNLSTFLFHHNRHKNRYFQINVFKCVKCGKVFSKERNLRTHLLEHIHGSGKDSQVGIPSEKPDFPCGVCHKSFYCNSELQNHFLLHVYDCPWCKRMFQTFGELNQHLMAFHSL